MKLHILIILILSTSWAAGQNVVSFSGGYYQSFNGLDDVTDTPTTFPYYTANDLSGLESPLDLTLEPFKTSGLNGWYFRNSERARLPYRVYGLEGAGSGFINWGLQNRAFGAISNTIDRAIGSISNGTTAKPQFGVVMRNDTGEVIDSLEVSFAGEQWRGPGFPLSLVFDYHVGTASSIDADVAYIQPGGNFDFSAEKAGIIFGRIDGRVDGLGGTLEDLNWFPGEYLIMRWTNGLPSSGLGINDLEVGNIAAPQARWIWMEGDLIYHPRESSWLPFSISGAWGFDFEQDSFILIDNAVEDPGWLFMDYFPLIYSLGENTWYYAVEDTWPPGLLEHIFPEVLHVETHAEGD